jgi:hypothetical protein
LVGDSVMEFKNFLWALYALYVISIRFSFIIARLDVLLDHTSWRWCIHPWRT